MCGTDPVPFPGLTPFLYHVINRGDRREDIFKNDFDRQCFLETLADACAKTQWEIHAYCLKEMGAWTHLNKRLYEQRREQVEQTRN